MQFRYYSGHLKPFFALLPHACWACGTTFWLERGFRRRLSTRPDYRCRKCYPIILEEVGA